MKKAKEMKKLTDENFNLTNGIVKFGAEWCGPCKVVHQLLEEITETDVYEVNIDECPELTSKFNIRNVPTLLFFKDGNVVDKLVGSVNKQQILDKL